MGVKKGSNAACQFYAKAVPAAEDFKKQHFLPELRHERVLK
jgi:hypothetical protein